MKQKKEIKLKPAGIVHLHDQAHLDPQAARRIVEKAHARGELVQLFRGTYILTRNWPNADSFPHGIDRIRASFARKRLECIAIGQSNPERILTGHAAALVHGLPMLNPPENLKFVAPTTRRRSTRTTCSGTTFSLVHANLHPDECTTIDGARVTTLARTVVDIAAEAPGHPQPSHPQPDTNPNTDSAAHFRRFAEALALADAALCGDLGTLGARGTTAMDTLMWPDTPSRFLPADWETSTAKPTLAKPRHRAISSGDLLRHVRNSRGRIRGSRVAEILIAASPFSDSVFESVAKALLIELQVAFVQQPRIVDEDGAMVARVDFLLPEYGVIVECDGRMKYEPGEGDVRALADPWNDRRRDFDLNNLGYQVIHLTWDDILGVDAPAEIVETCSATRQLRSAIETAISAPHPQVPRGRWFDATTQLPPDAYRRFNART